MTETLNPSNIAKSAQRGEALVGLPPLSHEPMNDVTSAALADYIRQLTTRYVGNPAGIEVAFQDSTDGACYFALRGDQRDDSKLIGQQGSHVNSLNFLIESAGRAQGRTFTFRLHTNEGRHLPYPNGKDALTYDFRQDRDLLCSWLTALGLENFSVEVTPGKGARSRLSFDFEVRIPNYQKALEMTAPVNGLSKIGALGTLYRAIAMQKGVRFQVTLVERR